MYFRKIITRKNGKEYRYLKLLENYREGSKTRHSVVANLGNLDNFTHEKFQALVGSLMRIAETELFRGVGNKQPDSMNDADFKKLRVLWRQLKLPELINRIVPELKDPEPSLLAEAMVIGLINRPCLDLAVEKYYRELLPELVWQDLDGAPFYRILEALGSSKSIVENHLSKVFQQLTGRKGDLLFVKLGSGDYEGSRCELSHHGQGYLVRPYKQPLLIALLINDSGWPLGFRILWRGGTADSHITKLLREVIQEEDARRYVALFDQQFDPGGEGLYDDLCSYIVVEKPKNLIQLPVSAFEMIHHEDFFTRVQSDLWIKQVEAQGFKYILCYHPDQRNGEHLQQRLSSALTELEGVSKAIAENRLRRKKAVAGRVAEILNRHGCSEYITYVYNSAAHVLVFEIKQAAIDEYKIIRDTWLIKTNLYHLPPGDIVRNCLNIKGMDVIFRTVKDFTKIPWVPQLDTNSVQRVIEGHVVIRLLAFLLNHLFSCQTTEQEGGMCVN